MHDKTSQTNIRIDTSLGDAELIDAVGDLVERDIGQNAMVFHEPTDDPIHLDLYWVPSRQNVPYHTIVTSGMASKAMGSPQDASLKLYAELCTMLPHDWPIPSPDDAVHRTDVPGAWWPLNMVKVVAKFPHVVGTALGVGHTVQITDGTFEFSRGVRFSGVILLPGNCVHPSLEVLRLASREVDFLSVFPLYPEEMAFRVANGLEAFLDVLAKTQLGIPDLWQPDRVNVCGQTRGIPAGASPKPANAGRPDGPTNRWRWWWPF